MAKQHGHLSDAQYQNRVREIEKRRERQRVDDLRKLLKDPAGRRVFYYIIFELGRLNELSFNPAIKDGVNSSQHMAINEGCRSLAREFKTNIEDADSDGFLTMMAEEIAERHKALNYQAEAKRESDARGEQTS